MRIQAKPIAAVFTLLCLVVVIAWYGFFEPPWLSYRGLPWALKADSGHENEMVGVRVGEVIPYYSERCNDTGRERTYITSRFLRRVDAEEEPIRLDSNPTTALPGCQRALSGRNRVPDTATVGAIYFIGGTAEVNGRWLTHAVPWRSQPFRILPKAQ